jgi:hypothetical protein
MSLSFRFSFGKTIWLVLALLLPSKEGLGVRRIEGAEGAGFFSVSSSESVAVESAYAKPPYSEPDDNSRGSLWFKKVLDTGPGVSAYSELGLIGEDGSLESSPL